MSLPDRIPVYFLSGFLGAGKSTLLNQLLDDPVFQDTALIINEFGDVPVDHLLVRQGETTISQVSTGCLCCASTSDIRTTLTDLYYAGQSNASASFSRVVVEMSGLGDPAPLVNALTADPNDRNLRKSGVLGDAFYIAGFVSLFDVMSGFFSIDNHFEAIKQIAFADRIVLTKTDLADSKNIEVDFAEIKQELRQVNAGAQIVDKRDADLSEIFSPRSYAAVNCGEDVAGWLALEAAITAEEKHASHSSVDEKQQRHGSNIQTFSIVCDEPLTEKRVKKFLSVLRDTGGNGLLRVKGIVATEESPDRPLIIHAVQHVMSDPVRLDAWPDQDQRTRLVFITSGIDPKPVRELFSAIINTKSKSSTRWFLKLAEMLKANLFKPMMTLTNKSGRIQ